ncbi:MAG: SpoIIE family protein phosphatase [Gammaproteobacteria bacterium]|nr:SpoIIE family protein phosphatase [Gammaproteobacteria bacterium]
MSRGNDPQKILIVEDSPVQAVLLKRLLTGQGLYAAVIAKNGRKGLEAAQTHKPDLIISDIRMPEMDGYQLCAAVRDDPLLRNTPVLILTELSDPKDIIRALKAGADNYVTKPFDEQNLFSKVRDLLSAPYVYEQGGQADKREVLFEGERHEISADPQRILNLLLSTYDNVVRQNRELVDTQEKLRLLNEQLEQMASRLKAENLRMSAELAVTRRLQQMVLPEESELEQIDGLDIAAFMQPATEVGGDYYDILQYAGRVKIGIGDITGHGLESGVLMLMVQTAIRTLLNNNITDPVRFLEIINRTIYDNLLRIRSERNLSLCLLDYENGVLRLSGQHEDVLVVRKNGEIEKIDTFDLGFTVGLEEDISAYVAQREIRLSAGDGIVLYTDGITEATDRNENLFGQDRLCEVISQNWSASAKEIQQAVVANVREHIGEQEVYDDITLLVLKQQT